MLPPLWSRSRNETQGADFYLFELLVVHEILYTRNLWGVASLADGQRLATRRGHFAADGVIRSRGNFRLSSGHDQVRAISSLAPALTGRLRL